jgi:hypothetical protein
MAKYFENFPMIEYEGQMVKDITRRVNFTNEVSLNPLLYLPYTVKEGERAEDVAQFYYGSTDYTWLVYFSNNIQDPYHEWTKSEAEFNDYLVSKYTEQSGLIGEYVVDWTRDETNDDNVLYYYREV